MQKAQKEISSCSSISSLSDITLRNRTISRDSILCFSEDNAFCDSLNNVLLTNTSKILSSNRKKKCQKCCPKKEPVRKLKKTKRDISKKPEWKIQETIVLAPFHALKECFQNQLKEICGQKNLSNGFANKTANEVVEVESLVPIFEKNENNLKRKRCSVTPEESNYCDCFDNSSNSFLESCTHIPNKNQKENDFDNSDSSVIVEQEQPVKRFKKGKGKPNSDISYEFSLPTTSAPKKSKPSRPQNKRKIKEKRLQAEREPKLLSRNKYNPQNTLNKNKNSCNEEGLKNKGPMKRSQPRYRTRSVTKRESEKKDRLLNMMRAQKEIITKLEELESKNQSCQKKKICHIQTDNDLARDRRETSENVDPTQGPSNEPPCIVLHPFDPSKRKAEGNLTDYSSDESIQEPSYEELEKRNSTSNLNPGIQDEKNFYEKEGLSNLQNEKNDEELCRLEKISEDISNNSKENSTNPNVQQFLTLGTESTTENANNAGEPVVETERTAKVDFLFNSNDVAAETVEPSIIVQEHYNEPSSVEFSVSDEHEEYEPINRDSPNHMELPSYCCSLQESDQQTDLPTAGYIFGPRNDFSRLRESCEFSFGLSRTMQDDQESDTGDYFELSRNFQE